MKQIDQAKIASILGSEIVGQITRVGLYGLRKADDGRFLCQVADQLLAEAEKLAQTSRSWVDFSNALFDPQEGIVARAFPDREDRSWFMLTKQYRSIRDLIEKVMEKDGPCEPAPGRPECGAEE